MHDIDISREPWVRRALDVISAACAAAWPGSAAVRDARRLGADEYAGRVCNIEFLVDLPAERAIVVANDLRDAGFDVSLPGSLPDGFLVVRAQIPVRAYHLHRLTTRLTRLVRRYAAAAVVVACVFSQPMVTRGLAA